MALMDPSEPGVSTAPLASLFNLFLLFVPRRYLFSAQLSCRSNRRGKFSILLCHQHLGPPINTSVMINVLLQTWGPRENGNKLIERLVLHEAGVNVMNKEWEMSGLSLGTKQMVLYRTTFRLVTISTLPAKMFAFKQGLTGLIQIVRIWVMWQANGAIYLLSLLAPCMSQHWAGLQLGGVSASLYFASRFIIDWANVWINL